MPAPELLVWVDCESTGLLTDPEPPTLLEMAYTVTDTLGQQRTPLAQAFVALPTSQMQSYGHTHLPAEFGPGLVTPTLVNGTDNRPVGGWPNTGYPSDAVIEMHHENGLATEWAQQAAGPDAGRILRHWHEVERLLLDALDMAGWRGLDRGQAILAGGGVSHYEDRFLREFCPRVFGDKRLHYAVADTSTVLRTLRARALTTPGEDGDDGFPGTADRLIERYRPEVGDPDATADWIDIRTDPRRYDAADRCGWTRYVGDDGTTREHSSPHWALMERDNHRAAPGIARALMAYRLLPRLLADTRVPVPAAF